MKHMRTLLCTGAMAAGLALSHPTAALQGRVLSLDGAGDFLEAPDAVSLHSSREITITAWFRLEDGHRAWQALVWKGDLPDRHPFGNREFGVYHQSRGYMHLCAAPVSRSHAGQLYVDTPGGAVQPGQWYHVAATLSAADNSMRIYLNGDLLASRPFDRSGLRNSTGPLWLGGIPGTGANLRGLLDEVRIWGRALTAGEIRHNMNRAPATGERDLLARYAFDSLTPSGQVPDLSGHGHDGTLLGDAHLKTINLFAPPLTSTEEILTPPRVEDGPVVTTTTVTNTEGGGTTTTTTSVPMVTLQPGAAPAVAPAALAGDATPAPTTGITGDAAYLLIQALGSHDPAVRHTAAHALSRVDGVAFVPVMKVALQSHDPVVRRRAAEVLANAGPLGWESWWEGALADQATALRGQTVEALANSVADVLAERGKVVASSSPRWKPDRYRGWEHKWSAMRPDFWDLEPEGLRMGYNRVDGLHAGWRVARAYHQPRGVAHFGEAGYSLANDQWRYQLGGEVFTFYGPPVESANLVAVGVEAHDLVDSQDGWLISEEENSLHAALFRRDYRDYYRRTGWSAYTSHNLGGVLQVTARYGRDDFASMEEVADWVLFDNRFSRGQFRPNPAIDEGLVHSVRADVQLDTRDRRRAPQQGWFANGLVERAGGVLAGDYEFKRYLLDLRRYQPVGRGARLDLRARVGTAKGDLPRQYLYDLGGFSSLRGYPFKYATGDRMVLFNAEYWLDGDSHFGDALPVQGLGAVAFFDAGTAWFAGDRSDPFDGLEGLLEGVDRPDFHRSIGVGLTTADQTFRVEMARPLDGDSGEWRLYARVSRTF